MSRLDLPRYANLTLCNYQAAKQMKYNRDACLFSSLEHEHPKMPHERTSSVPLGSKGKRTKLQKRSSQLYDQKLKRNISDDDLAHHVSSMYINGPGGLLMDAAKKRERFVESTMSFDNEHVDLLRKLDQHPTLVLNADYQVSQDDLY